MQLEMAELKSVESITLINCTKKLETALSSDNRDIAHFMNAKGWISDEVHSDVTNPKSLFSATEKAGFLVSALKKKVKLNPQNFQIFLEHIRQDRYHSDIAEILDREHERISKVHSVSTEDGGMFHPLLSADVHVFKVLNILDTMLKFILIAHL